MKYYLTGIRTLVYKVIHSRVVHSIECHVIPRRPSDGLDFRVRRKGLTESDMEDAAGGIREHMKHD